MDRENIEFFLKSVCAGLGVLPTEDLERHVEECERSLSHVESFGCLMDPTAYLKDRDSGRIDDARLQLKIVKHLLAARKCLDEREEFVKSLKARK
jgi:hypothetical protein